MNERTYLGDLVSNPLNSSKDQAWGVNNFLFIIFQFSIGRRLVILNFYFRILKGGLDRALVVHINAFDLK
jgi:hypothetical protein